MAGQGYAQSIARMLQERLPGYVHRTERVVNVRIYDILKSKDACFPAAPYQGIDLSAERRDCIVFSSPAFLFFYHGLIARKDRANQIRPFLREGGVDFGALISDTTLTGAYQPGRTYSRWLNEIFATHSGSANMFRWSGQLGLTRNMFKMLEAGRFDYFVDYSMLLKFHEMSEGHINEFDFYPLAEHAGHFGLGSIACRNSPVGRQLMEHINIALASLKNTPEFREANSRWLIPEGQEALYWDLWDSQIITATE